MIVNKRNRAERVELVVYLATLLKNYPVQHGQHLDLYNSEFPAIKDLKKQFTEFINQDDSNPKLLIGASGKVPFPEMGRKIEYILPIKKSARPFLVFRVHN
jgi:hypothetical protein